MSNETSTAEDIRVRRDPLDTIRERGPAGVVIQCQGCQAMMYQLTEKFDPDRIRGAQMERTDFYRRNNWPKMPADAKGDNVCCGQCGAVFFLGRHVYARFYTAAGNPLDRAGFMEAVRDYRATRREIEDRERAEAEETAEREADLRASDAAIIDGLAQAVRLRADADAAMPTRSEEALEEGALENETDESKGIFERIAAHRAEYPESTWREIFEAFGAGSGCTNHRSLSAAYNRWTKRERQA